MAALPKIAVSLLGGFDHRLLPPSALLSGPVHCDCCLPAFLLLGVLLLGADGGMAVLPSRHWQNEATAHPQTFPVPRLG